MIKKRYLVTAKNDGIDYNKYETNNLKASINQFNKLKYDFLISVHKKGFIRIYDRSRKKYIKTWNRKR